METQTELAQARTAKLRVVDHYMWRAARAMWICNPAISDVLVEANLRRVARAVVAYDAIISRLRAEVRAEQEQLAALEYTPAEVKALFHEAQHDEYSR